MKTVLIRDPEYASDIAAVHPGKKVTLMHSRQQLLPRFDPSMHTESKSCNPVTFIHAR